MADTQTLQIKLTGDGRGARAEIGATGEAARQLGDRAIGLSRTFSAVGQTLVAAFAADRIIAAGRAIAEITTRAEALGRGLTAALGTQSAGAAGLTYVTGAAEQLGLRLRSTGEQFTAFAASTRGTRLEGAQTQAVFQAVAEAATALGLSTETTGHAFTALAQMASKGSVASEELKGQLGEALPGAFGLAAQALGVTTARLQELLDSGSVLAEDLLPKLAARLHQQYGPAAASAARGAAQEWNRFTNAVESSAAAFGSGWLDDAARATRHLTAAITDPAVDAALRRWGVLIGELIRLADQYGVAVSRGVILGGGGGSASVSGAALGVLGDAGVSAAAMQEAMRLRAQLAAMTQAGPKSSGLFGVTAIDRAAWAEDRQRLVQLIASVETSTVSWRENEDEVRRHANTLAAWRQQVVDGRRDLDALDAGIRKATQGLSTPATVQDDYQQRAKALNSAYGAALAESGAAGDTERYRKLYADYAAANADLSAHLTDAQKAANARADQLDAARVEAALGHARAEYAERQRSLDAWQKSVEDQHAAGQADEQTYTNLMETFARQRKDAEVEYLDAQLAAARRTRTYTETERVELETKIADLLAQRARAEQSSADEVVAIQRQAARETLTTHRELDEQIARMRRENITDPYARLDADAAAEREQFSRDLRERYHLATEAQQQYLAQFDEQQAAALQRQRDALDPAVKLYERAAEQIYQGWSTMWEDLFTGGIRSFKDFGKQLTDYLRRLLGQLAAQALARPVLVPVITALGGTLGMSQSAIGGTLQQIGLGGTGAGTGAADGGGFGIGNLSSLSNLFGGNGLGSTLGGLLGGAQIGAYGVGATAPGAGLSFAASSSYGYGAAGTGSALGNAAAGFSNLAYGAAGLGGGLIGGWIAPNSQYGSLAGSLGGVAGMVGAEAVASAAGGAAAGAAAGSVVPVIGTIIGAVLGGLVAKFSGDSKPDSSWFRVTSGARSGRDAKYAPLAEAQTAFGSVAVSGWEDLPGKMQAEFSKGIVDAFAQTDAALAQQLGTQYVAIARQAIDGQALASARQLASKDPSAQVLAIFRARYGAIFGAIDGDLAAAFARAPATADSIGQVVAELGELFSVTHTSAPSTLGPYAAQLLALDTQFGRLAANAQKYGYAVAEVAVAQARAAEQVRAAFNADVATQLRQITDPVGLALEQLDQAFTAIRADATAVGGDLVAVERLYGAKRTQILAEQLAEQTRLQRSLQDLDVRAVTARSVIDGSDGAKTAADAYTLAVRQAQELASASTAAERAALASVHALETAAAAAERERAAAADRISTARQAYVDALHRESDALAQTRDRFRQFADTLNQFRTSLQLQYGQLSPEARLAATRQQFERTAALAQLGNEDALGALTGVSQQYLDAAKDYYASSAGYFSALDAVEAATAAAASTATRQADIAARQYDVMQAQLRTLGEIRDAVTVQQAAAAYAAAQGTAAATTTSVDAQIADRQRAADVDYLAANPDVAQAIADGTFSGTAADHWVMYGAAEGRPYGQDPHAGYDTVMATLDWQALALATRGGASGDERFREANYLAANPDVLRAIADGSFAGTAADHYRLYGLAEGRAFAAGGFAAPGLAIVGEAGPELVDFRTPARVYSADDSRALFAGRADASAAQHAQTITELRALVRSSTAGTGALLEALAALREQLARIERQQRLGAVA